MPSEASAVTKPSPFPQRLGSALRAEAKRYATDSLALVTAPLAWKSQDWQKAAAFGLILSGLLLADESLDFEAQQLRSPFTDEVSDATTGLGGQPGLYVSAGLLVAGVVFRKPQAQDMGRDALEVLLLTHLLNKYLLKPTFGRKRPAESDGETSFHPFSHYSSFPSAHATQAFALASVVAARSKGWVVPTLAYTAATLVAFDRVNDRAHFASDVFAGAVLGTAVARFLVNRHRRQGTEGPSRMSMEIAPIPYGLRLYLRF